jgi:hypothetical protein
MVTRGPRGVLRLNCMADARTDLYHAISASVAGLVHVLFPGVMQRVSQFEESRTSTE